VERLAADEWHWASEDVDRRVAEDTDVIALLVGLADGAPDDPALAYLGAGPVESLVVGRGAAVVDEVEAAARRSERFQIALRCAWFDETLPPDAAERLRRFGPPI
jgi:hypothetical protein